MSPEIVVFQFEVDSPLIAKAGAFITDLARKQGFNTIDPPSVEGLAGNHHTALAYMNSGEFEGLAIMSRDGPHFQLRYFGVNPPGKENESDEKLLRACEEVARRQLVEIEQEHGTWDRLTRNREHKPDNSKIWIVTTGLTEIFFGDQGYKRQTDFAHMGGRLKEDSRFYKEL